MFLYLAGFASGLLVGGVIGAAYMFVKMVDAAFSDLSRTIARRDADTASETPR